MNQQVVWLIGDYWQPDFAEPIAWLRSRAECHLLALPRYALVAAAIGRPPPAAVVLLETRPGDILPADVAKLQTALPLARFIALAGPWCDGERRSNRQTPGVVRIPWQSWRWRLPTELGSPPVGNALRGVPITPVGNALRGVPSTTDRAPPRNASQTPRLTTAPNLRALILTCRPDLYESLADALKALGASSVWHEKASARQLSAADVLLCDGWEHADGCHAQRPKLVLLHFPRFADERRAAASDDIAGIIPLPFVLSDLAAAVHSVRREPT
jgi:hypothetical protein